MANRVDHNLGPARRFAAAALLSLAAWGLAPALAADPAVAPPPPNPPPPSSEIGRFTMTPVADGFLRLDTRSGQTSLCTVAKGQAECRSSADERAALEAEIARLARENAALKAGAQAKADPADPTDRQFDHAMDRAETFLRRMMRVFKDTGVLDKPAADPKPSSPAL